jgi:hypothetical protein
MIVKFVRGQRQPVWYSLFAVVTSCLLVGLFAVVYARHESHEANRKWCKLVVTLDDAYRRTPPSTESGKRVAAEIHNLRSEFQCPRSKLLKR